MKQMTIEMNISEAIERLNDLKARRFYKNLSLKDKVAFQFAVDFLTNAKPDKPQGLFLTPKELAKEVLKAYDKEPCSCEKEVKEIWEYIRHHDKLINEIFEHLWYLKKNSTHYKKLMKIHKPIMEAFLKKTDHFGDRIELGKKVKELSEKILESLEEENE